MSKGTEYTVEFFETSPNQDDSVVLHFQLKNDLNEDITPTLSPRNLYKKY